VLFRSHRLQITVAHALGYPGSTSCLLVTDLNTGIITLNLQILHINQAF
jgi:hypothetical protein